MPALEDKIREILRRGITDPDVLVPEALITEIANEVRDLFSANCPEGGCYADI